MPEDGVWSTLVAMVMPVELPAVAAPMVRPVTMTVTAVLAATVWAALVMTNRLLEGKATLPPPTPPIDTAGVPVLKKKLGGYVSVMLLPPASAPPAVVVNENVAAAGVFPATRSAVAIVKEVFVV